MSINDYLEYKGFKLNSSGVYELDIVEDKFRDILLVRCTPIPEKSKIEIVVQLGEPKSHMMSLVEIDVHELRNLDTIVSELTRKALYEYHKQIMNKYNQITTQPL